MRSIQLIGMYTIMRKEISRIFRIWPQTLLPSVTSTTLYFLIFGTFIGSRIGEVNDVSYIEFLIPGLIMMSVIMNGYMNVSSTFFGSKFQRNIDEMLVSPLSHLSILLGFISGGVLRSCIVGFLVTVVSMIFTPIAIHNIFLVIFTVVITATFFALGGFLNALYAKRFDDISIVPTFVLTPLTYLGGVFYSIELLPPFWRTLSLFNPILYIVNIFRYGFLGITDVPILTALITIILMTLGMFLLALWFLKKGVGLRL